MSINSSRVACTGCNYQTSEVYRPIIIKYQTTGGLTVEASRTKGWCYQCESYADIEDLNREEFQEKLISQKHERDKIHYQLGELRRNLFSKLFSISKRRQLELQLERLEDSIRSLNTLIEIVSSRSSKARCLKCGSDKTVPLTFNSQSGFANNFKHECGGSLRFIHDWQGPRFYFNVSTYIINEEGELIAGDA